MIRWTRATQPLRCGYDFTHEIPAGSPVQETVIPGVRRPLVRCGLCAGPVPPDLPAHVVTRAETGGGFTRPMTRLVAAGVDWKSKQSGE